MKIKKLPVLFLCLFVAFFAMAAASCGGGGGGGSSPTVTPTPTPTPTEDPTFRKEDLAGTWTYSAGPFTGIMVYNTEGTIVKVTVEQCGTTTYNVTNYIDDTGAYAYNIYTRAYNYCNHSTYLMKFALTSAADKQSATGIADLHYNGDGGNFTRYSCSMVKNAE